MTESDTRERLPYPDLPVRNGRPDHPAGPQTASRGEGPARRPEAPHSENTIIDRKSHFDGSYRSDSDLVIQGTFEGEIDCKGTVTVAEGASVSAKVRAKNVVIAGSTNGEISCDERLMLVSTAEMRGKAQAGTLSIEEGAFFEGEFVMGGGGAFTSSSGFADWESARSAKDSTNKRGLATESSNREDKNESRDTKPTRQEPSESRETAASDSS